MSFEKIIGYENVKEELSRLLDVLKNKEKYAKLGNKRDGDNYCNKRDGI